jgi:hypothetical protein
LSDVLGKVFWSCDNGSDKSPDVRGFTLVKTLSNYSHQPSFLNAIASSYDAEFNGEFFAYLIQTNF